MVRLSITQDSVKLWLSARDTAAWAKGELDNDEWPCSTLAGHRVFAEFDSNGLCDLTINYGSGVRSTLKGWDLSNDANGAELSAMCADFLRRKLPRSHPLYFITVGQFEEPAQCDS